MASPTYSGGSAGNALASQSLPANAALAPFVVDLTTDYEGRLQVGATFGTISGTSGLQVQVFEEVGATPVADTVAGAGSFTIAAVAGAQARTVRLQTGRYKVVLTNLDPTNGLTGVYATLDTAPSIA